MPASGQRLRNELHRFDTTLQQKEAQQQLDYVTAHLASNPRLLQRVHGLILGGALESVIEKPAVECWHRSAIRFSDLSVKSLTNLIGEMAEGLDGLSLKKAEIAQKGTIRKLFCQASQVALVDRLPSKKVCETVMIMKARYIAAGSRLKHVVFMENGQAEWTTSGICTISEDNATVRHICGQEADLPISIEDDYTISETCPRLP